MYYGEIKKCDIANGEGVRVSLFVSGCTHHCPGCFNADTWNFKYGSEKTLVGLLRKVRESYPEKNIWCYTGYLYDEQLLNNSRARCEYTDEMLSMIDVLVDGEFVEALKDIRLVFRGSSNQRVIDVKKSLGQNEIVMWQPKVERGV